jgi:hypothetical protein
VLTQSLQKSQNDTKIDEPPFIGSNETVLNVEPILGSVSVGDVVADVGMISCVNPHPIATVVTLSGDAPSVEPTFMPEYDVVFEDERVEDSTDDRPVLDLNNRNKVLLQRALTEHAAEVPDCRNLSQAHRVVVDGLLLDDNVDIINNDNVVIWNGIVFNIMKAMKIWLVEYAVFHHHSFIVKHSDKNKHCLVICHRGCP